MVYYDNLIYDQANTLLTIKLDSFINSSILDDATNKDIVEITLKTFLFTDTTVVDNYISLPNHYHTLKDVSDIEEKTNTENGFVRLIDNNIIKMDFP